MYPCTGSGRIPILSPVSLEYWSDNVTLVALFCREKVLDSLDWFECSDECTRFSANRAWLWRYVDEGGRNHELCVDLFRERVDMGSVNCFGEYSFEGCICTMAGPPHGSFQCEHLTVGGMRFVQFCCPVEDAP
jgi:hypothetical protein